MRLHTQLRDALLQKAHRNVQCLPLFPIAGYAAVGEKALEHGLHLLLRDEAPRVRGHEVVAVTVLVDGALRYQALSLSHIPDVYNVPKHGRMAVALKYVADARLPREGLVVVGREQRANDVAGADSEGFNAQVLCLRVDILLCVLFAHGVSDIPVPFHLLHVPVLFLLVHGGPGGLRVLISLGCGVRHSRHGARVHDALDGAGPPHGVHDPLGGIEPQSVHALRGGIGAVVAQLRRRMENTAGALERLVV
mmetsp:Transcript_32835/g.90691  ORF Transcript_32835/g.90691 Transcript_32835/m.90691 type:complete len:250 (-) Transcript_32835:177-926(-)